MAALGWLLGDKAYLRSSWNILDGILVMISAIDILVSLVSNSSPKILGMLRVLRLLRTLRPLRWVTQTVDPHKYTRTYTHTHKHIRTFSQYHKKTCSQNSTVYLPANRVWDFPQTQYTVLTWHTVSLRPAQWIKFTLKSQYWHVQYPYFKTYISYAIFWNAYQSCVTSVFRSKILLRLLPTRVTC